MTSFSSKDIAEMPGAEFEKHCRDNTFYAYLGNSTGLCRVLGKSRMFVDTRDTGVVPHFITDGFWETWVTQSLAKIIEPGFTCIDIGANYGYFSMLMSDLTGPNGRTIAVEPNPYIAGLLRQTEGVHHCRFEIAEMALSDRSGRAILSIPDQQTGDASIIDRPDRGKVPSTKVKVILTTLDLLMEKMNIQKVDVIKMDVEGVEPQVFKGMTRTIAANPHLQIILEYSPFLYQNAGEFTSYLFDNFTVTRIKDVETSQVLDAGSIETLLRLTDHTDLLLSVKA